MLAGVGHSGDACQVEAFAEREALDVCRELSGGVRQRKSIIATAI